MIGTGWRDALAKGASLAKGVAEGVASSAAVGAISNSAIVAKGASLAKGVVDGVAASATGEAIGHALADSGALALGRDLKNAVVKDASAALTAAGSAIDRVEAKATLGRAEFVCAYSDGGIPLLLIDKGNGKTISIKPEALEKLAAKNVEFAALRDVAIPSLNAAVSAGTLPEFRGGPSLADLAELQQAREAKPTSAMR